MGSNAVNGYSTALSFHFHQPYRLTSSIFSTEAPRRFPSISLVWLHLPGIDHLSRHHHFVRHGGRWAPLQFLGRNFRKTLIRFFKRIEQLLATTKNGFENHILYRKLAYIDYLMHAIDALSEFCGPDNSIYTFCAFNFNISKSYFQRTSFEIQHLQNLHLISTKLQGIQHIVGLISTTFIQFQHNMAKKSGALQPIWNIVFWPDKFQ